VGLIVVDASAVVEMLAADDEPRRGAVAMRLSSRGDALFAPNHLDVEVVSALRGIARRNEGTRQNGPGLLAYLYRMPVRRVRLSANAMGRVWRLRDNLTTYDAGYVALAEELGASVVTCDAKFPAPPGVACAIELIR
jgi:predicted nucleic acid-binding protein